MSIQILQNILHPVHLSLNSETRTDREKLSDANGKLFLEILDCEGINKIWPHNGVLSFETLDCRELIFSKSGQASLRLSQIQHSCFIQKEELPRSFNGRKRLQWTEASGTIHFRNFLEKPLPNEKLNSFRSQQRLSEWTIATPEASSSSTLEPTSLKGFQQFSFPILLIRNQGCQEISIPLTSLASPQSMESMGWDLVLPTSCAMIVWSALVFAGSRSTGLEEMSFINHCLRIPDFPCDFPDTPAGKQYWQDIKSSQQSLEAKRPNRKKTTSTSLSWPHWPEIYPPDADPAVATEDNDIPSFVVIRNMEYLSPFLPSSLSHQRNRYFHRKRSVLFDIPSSGIELEPLTLPFRTAIRVILIATGRGIPQRGAQIFAPSTSDYHQWIHYRSKRNQKTIARGRRVADWWGNQIRNGTETQRERDLIGFVTSSVNSSLSRNPRLGIGFCEALSLRETLHGAGQVCEGEGQMLVMFRNSGSEWYRPGLIQIQTF
jgi:hypothetical protein